MTQDPLICNVCNKNEAVGVASSSLGPVSFAYCTACLANHADVEFMYQYLFDEAGGDATAFNPDMTALYKVYRDGEYITFAEWLKTAVATPDEDWHE